MLYDGRFDGSFFIERIEKRVVFHFQGLFWGEFLVVTRVPSVFGRVPARGDLHRPNKLTTTRAQPQKMNENNALKKNPISLEKAGKSASTMFRQSIRTRWIWFARLLMIMVIIGAMVAYYSTITQSESTQIPNARLNARDFQWISIHEDSPVGAGSASVKDAGPTDWISNTVLLVCMDNCDDETSWYPQHTNSTLYILPRPANIASFETAPGSIMRPPFGPLLAEFASGASVRRKRNHPDDPDAELPPIPEWLLPEEVNSTETVSEGILAPTDDTSTLGSKDDTLGPCVHWYSFEEGDSCYTVSNGLVFQLTRLNPTLDCTEIRRGQTICLARLDPDFEFNQEWKCIQSCGSIDNAASVFAKASPDMTISCAGKSSGQCTWYKSDNCNGLTNPPLEVGRDCTPLDFLAGNWCSEAQRQILQDHNALPCVPTPDPVLTLITMTASVTLPTFVSSLPTTKTKVALPTTEIEDFTCMRSCADSGYYLLAVDKGDSVQCAGSDVTSCTWFKDDQCIVLAPLSAPVSQSPVQGFSCSPLDGGWCREARRVVQEGLVPTVCNVTVLSSTSSVSVSSSPASVSSSSASVSSTFPRTTGTPIPPLQQGDKCIRSCGDRGNFLRVRKTQTGVQCLGKSQGMCAWYTEPSCSLLVPLSEHPVGRNGVVCVGVASGWCAEADGQLNRGQGQTVCPGLPLPPPAYTPSTTTTSKAGLVTTTPSTSPTNPWKCITSCPDKGHSLFVRNKGSNVLGCFSQWSFNCTWYEDGACGGLAQPILAGAVDGVQCGYNDVNTPGTWCSEANNQIVFKLPQTPCGPTSKPTATPVSSNGRCGVEVGTKCDGSCCSQYGICGTSDDHCLVGCRVGWGECRGNQPAPPIVPQPPVVINPNKPRVIGYFPSWGPDILRYNLSGITTINYAFFSMDQNGGLVSLGADYSDNGLISKLNNVVKKQYPGLTTVVSIGGWTDSRWFSVVAANPVTRQRFAQNVYNFVTRYGFDGVDLDWEFPGGGGNAGNTESPNDAANHVLMIQEIRKLFGSKYLITIASSSDVSRYRDTVPALNRLLDWINVVRTLRRANSC